MSLKKHDEFDLPSINQCITNSHYSAVPFTVSPITFLTTRLAEVQNLIETHQKDLRTRHKTHHEQLERYRRARFDMFKAACGKPQGFSPSPINFTPRLMGLIGKEETLRELVNMLEEGNDWMAAKLATYKREEKDLLKRLERHRKRRNSLARMNAEIGWRCEPIQWKVGEVSKATSEDGLDGIL